MKVRNLSRVWCEVSILVSGKQFRALGKGRADAINNLAEIMMREKLFADNLVDGLDKAIAALRAEGVVR